MSISRRHLMLGCGVATVAFSHAHAQGVWPERPIRFVIPFPPGGSSDAIGRVIAERLRVLVGAPAAVPDNKPGGTASIGTEFVARAEPDGYTLLLANSPAFTVLPHMRKLGYEIGSFESAGGVAEYLAVVTVRKELQATTLAELISLAKGSPGKLTVGSSGTGSLGHINAEVLKRHAAIDLLHVPFRGSQDAATAMMGGQIDMIIDGLGTGLAKSGRARALACFANMRHPELSDVPSLSEAGIKIDLPPAAYGILAPKGTPAPIMRRISDALATILSEPDTRARLERVGLVPVRSSPTQYRKDLEVGRAFFGDLIKSAGIKES